MGVFRVNTIMFKCQNISIQYSGCVCLLLVASGFWLKGLVLNSQ